MSNELIALTQYMAQTSEKLIDQKYSHSSDGRNFKWGQRRKRNQLQEPPGLDLEFQTLHETMAAGPWSHPLKLSADRNLNCKVTLQQIITHWLCALNQRFPNFSEALEAAVQFINTKGCG